MLPCGEQLTRVRTEIDQLQGRLQALKDLTAMTTLEVGLRERGQYVPAESRGFGTTIERTFTGSVDTLVGFGKAVVLASVAVAPWLPVIFLVVISAWFVLRPKSRPCSIEAVSLSPGPSPPAPSA